MLRGWTPVGGVSPYEPRILIPAELAVQSVTPEWWTSWTFQPVNLGIILIGLELYVLAYRRVPAFPRKRLYYFVLGSAGLALAMFSPVGTYDGVLFWVHMIQHMLLIFVAAPLFCLASPVALTLRALPVPARRGLSGVLRSPPLRTLTHPVFTWILFQAVMRGTHFSDIYEATLTNPAIHVGEHILYLFAGYLFWRPIVGLDPGPRHSHHLIRLLYMLSAMAPMAFLGLAIYSSDHVLYPYYGSVRSSPAYAWLPSALSDQRMAGEIMWVIGFFCFIIAIVFLFFDWIRAERREEQRVDRRLDRLTSSDA